MTPKENLIKVLSHEQPEWIPCTPHIANMSNIPGQLPSSLLNEPIDYLNISRFLNDDILFEVFASKPIYSEQINHYSFIERNMIIEKMITPIGSLINKKQISLIETPKYDNMPSDLQYPPPIELHTGIEFPIKTIEDYKILRFIAKSTDYMFDTNQINEAINRVGNNGVVVLSGPSTPFYNLIAMQAGLENTIFHLCDNPDEVEETMHVMSNRNYGWYEKACKTYVDVIRCTEDLDTNLISPAMFEKYSAPVIKRYAQICHDHGKLLMLHACGHIKEFLPIIKETKVDAIHCLCPPLTGNTPLSYAKEVLGNEVTIMARIDPPILLNKTPEEVASAVKSMLNEVLPADSFMIILPCGRAPLANLRSAISTVRKYGNYPVTLL